jgi:hypothetical protein
VTSAAVGGWLRCPVCGRDLALAEDGPTGTPSTVGCSSGHRFEANRRGYFALTDGPSRLIRSEPAAELDAVDRRWAAPPMQPVLDAVIAAAPAPRGLRLLDVGTDLGHAAGQLLGERSDWSALSASSSPSAVARSMACAGSAGLLFDPTRAWPVRDSAADVLLTVLGSHAPAEYHRVLAPGGIVLAVIAESAAAELMDDLYPWFEHDQTRAVAADVPLAVLRLRRRRRELRW